MFRIVSSFAAFVLALLLTNPAAAADKTPPVYEAVSATSMVATGGMWSSGAVLSMRAQFAGPLHVRMGLGIEYLSTTDPVAVQTVGVHASGQLLLNRGNWFMGPGASTTCQRLFPREAELMGRLERQFGPFHVSAGYGRIFHNAPMLYIVPGVTSAWGGRLTVGYGRMR